ncbi:hypothetical protein AGMMS49992_01800 [Clostridia bacterium]|nr:hypothetical protein AGMMS49992_01800 [Clostridia bacterium]
MTAERKELLDIVEAMPEDDVVFFHQIYLRVFKGRTDDECYDDPIIIDQDLDEEDLAIYAERKALIEQNPDDFVSLQDYLAKRGLE